MTRASALRRLLVAAGIAAGGSLLVAAPAFAALTSGEGTCTGTATFTYEDGSQKTYNQGETGVVKVPKEDTVPWTGTIDVEKKDDMPHEGFVKVKHPFGELKVRSWEGTTDVITNNGRQHYKIPSIVPGGAEMTIKGEHTQSGKLCAGEYKAELEGGPGVAGAASAAGTAVTGAGLALAGRAKR